jgi:maltooligosyltrehalose trehalohydrolase
VPDPQAAETFEQSRVDWDELGREPHAQLLAWYRDLIALRRARPDLRDPRLDLVRVEHDIAAQTVVVERGRHLVVANLASERRSLALATDLQIVLAWDPEGTSLDGAGLSLPAQSAVVLESAG